MYPALALLVALVIYGPSLWVRWVMYRHGKHLARMPGNGQELALHLIDRFELNGVGVEQGDADVNHFDPGAGMVRLSPELFSGKSITAIAVAAHEVGHAIQYHNGEKLIRWRSEMLPKVRVLEKCSLVFLLLIPVLGAATRIPMVMLFVALMFIVLMLCRIAFHVTTLPVEWDASFNKALPILIKGNYVPEAYVPAVRQVLRAAALTYVAAAVADLLSFWRWILFIR